ncbi:type II toxin-antitoxin system ParD family antitoxin [Nocardia salmonicida]|uniref:type II toxin-antitoxin system ParD family antitoxin n=1 Tax=Nocardia salmonicida TaxID=53431 RepID=UPI0007A4160B|nr:type II toxin-antitoxin system ParD family antitoxin [Nocardia salmonicida]
MERNPSKLEALRAALAAGEDSGTPTELDFERCIEELAAQAADADLMSDFQVGRLVRSNEPADVSELP